MARAAEITVASRLAARPDRVWDRVITPAGINDELRPIMRMTVPREESGQPQHRGVAAAGSCSSG